MAFVQSELSSLKKTVRNRHNRSTAGQWHTSHSATVPEETSRAGVNCVKQSVIDQAIDQWRDRLNACVKALNISCDVFVHNYQFVMTCNACITVVLNRLTHVLFHKVV